ncbi:hypothetical protein BC835DRAFT_1302449 [Cytidiella melzeri]|nr:hypothetical protein BC835DRAFT_1302449 [Cytidiella melzeri]
MSFAKLEKLAENARRAEAHVASVRVDFRQGTQRNQDVQEWRRAHRSDTQLYIKTLFDSYFNIGNDDRYRFEVSDVDAESFEVIDWGEESNGSESYRVTYDDIADPEFSVEEYLKKFGESVSTTLTRDDNTYPFYVDDNDGPHPAVNWLRIRFTTTRSMSRLIPADTS